jgi:hypothetical protein
MDRPPVNLCGLRLRTLFALVVFASAGLAAAVPGDANDAARAQQFRLDHFQCYRVDPTTPFEPRRVALTDQFGRSRAVALRLFNLCAPVRKNRTLPRNREAHLACYTLRRQRFAIRQVAVTNQFQRSGRLAVVRPSELCLPTGKTLEPDVRPRPVEGLDHYQCYLVRPLTRTRVDPPVLVDQFGRSRPAVGPAVRLCAPVRKNRTVPRNRREHLVCYQLQPREPFQPRAATIVNQFGFARLVVARPEWLCLPSLKRLLRPDLRVSIANAPIPVSCPGGFGTCVTTVNFTITNAGPVPVTTAFQVLIEADPGQARTITVSGLGAGASQTFSENLGPAGNCYDPDCTVRVTVDTGNAVAESNETNNSATRTDLG